MSDQLGVGVEPSRRCPTCGGPHEHPDTGIGGACDKYFLGNARRSTQENIRRNQEREAERSGVGVDPQISEGRDPHVMLALTQAALRVELGEANARITQLEADSRAYGEIASSAVRTARNLDKTIARVRALAAQWREDSQTFWADQLAQALDPNDLYPGLITHE